jgi:N-ethylmaleimide reductase
VPVEFFRPLFRGPIVANNGYTPSGAQSALEAGEADAVAFGKPFISNPDLVERFRRGAPLADGDPSTFYGGGEKGYVDYPALAG